MSESRAVQRGGLEGVVAADSAICKIDGEHGELRYRGYLIKDLAEHSNYIETVHLLWHGELPDRAQLEALRRKIAAQRELPATQMKVLTLLCPALEPMAALRTMVSSLSADDTPGGGSDEDSVLEQGARLTARLPTIVAAYERLRSGQDPIPPRGDLSHAGNFLYMLTGKQPDPEIEKMLDTCLLLHAEHGLNASTFSARVTAATLSDLYSALTSAIGTLKGPLHGGANTAVMKMLLQFRDVDEVEPALDRMLARGEKIMGFGHRVYKIVDPRALILKTYSRRLADLTKEPRWFEMSSKLEALVKARKQIDMNVDFYSASTYYYMGVPPDLFTCVFAMSRIAGWVAHVREQLANNRLIRPRSNWIGSGPRDYVALDQRT